jgi:zinc transport system substrate-binding protein
MMRIAWIALMFATPVMAEVPVVVTDFGPVQSLVADVMGDLGQPLVLLPAGGDPHDFQLKPSQAEELGRADLVIWAGPEMIPALGDALAALAPEAQRVALLQEGGGKLRAFDEGGADPHAWLDPQNAIAWTGAIAAALSAQDPENAAEYAANAAAAVAAMTALDAELTTMLAPVKDKPFVVYHDAMGYFTDHFGLAVAGAIELGDATTPSAARLAEIRDILAASGAICVFPEAGRDPKFIASLSEGLALKVGGEQDVEFTLTEAGRGQYPKLLRAIATSLVDCLGEQG